MSLSDVWAKIDHIQQEKKYTCQKVGGCDANCCRFVLSGIKPTISPAEKAEIEKYILEKKITVRAWSNDVCQFLVDSKCSIYAVRPIDCRTYNCGDTGIPENIMLPLDVNEVVFEYFSDNPDEVEGSDFINIEMGFHLVILI